MYNTIIPIESNKNQNQCIYTMHIAVAAFSRFVWEKERERERAHTQSRNPI